MAKLTLEGLRKLREEKKQSMDLRDSDNKNVQIVVGMGRNHYEEALKELAQANPQRIALARVLDEPVGDEHGVQHLTAAADTQLDLTRLITRVAVRRFEGRGRLAFHTPLSTR